MHELAWLPTHIGGRSSRHVRFLLTRPTGTCFIRTKARPTLRSWRRFCHQSYRGSDGGQVCGSRVLGPERLRIPHPRPHQRRRILRGAGRRGSVQGRRGGSQRGPAVLRVWPSRSRTRLHDEFRDGARAAVLRTGRRRGVLPRGLGIRCNRPSWRAAGPEAHGRDCRPSRAAERRSSDATKRLSRLTTPSTLGVRRQNRRPDYERGRDSKGVCLYALVAIDGQPRRAYSRRRRCYRAVGFNAFAHELRGAPPCLRSAKP